MDNDDLTLDQQKAEQVRLDSQKDEDVRAEIIAEYGFDEATDGERIEKLVTKTLDSNKKLSKAIAQKIKLREERDSLKSKVPEIKPPVVTPASPAPEPTMNLSFKDQRALDRADVHEDDIEEIVEYAKFKKLQVADVLNLTEIKAKLAEKAEFRKSAAAANAGGARRVTNKVTPEKLQADLREGKVPEPGSTEAEELFWARRGGKR